MTKEYIIKNQIISGIAEHCSNAYVPNVNAVAKLIKEKMLSANIAKKYKSELTDEDYQSIAAGYIRSYYAATDEVKAQFKSDNGIAQSAVRAMISIIKKGKQYERNIGNDGRRNYYGLR